MDVIFLNAAGQTLFMRSDMESGHWVQQEMSVNADFPFVPGKVIEIGQRIAFRDPATDTLQVFEIRNVVNSEPDHFQQLTAEHIVVSELSDEHFNSTEITGKTAMEALTIALQGTLWSPGTTTDNTTQSADFSRGSVWDAVNTIQHNWNVYITPRVVISSAGMITGRYLDITPAHGTWRGVRLSIRKNFLDPVVTYDDTEVLTAMFGYGGNVEVRESGQDDKTEELTFKDVVWTATAEHPAKPAGQLYLNWPEKTALYGRNGRPRYGYYQNGNIKDADVLLQKTWEALQRTCEPKISIAGTCADLYRLGYHDEPLRLHDMAIVEIEETGETFQKEIIMLDVDLVDPTGSRPEIGSYIPNIIYINRETNELTKGGRGGGGGGGGGRGQTNAQKDESETYTEFIKTNNMIGMVVGTRNGGYYVKAGEIVLAINKSGETGEYESAAYISADHINISATQDVHTLAGSVVRDAQGRLVIVDAGGLYVQRTDSGTTVTVGVWDRGNLTGGVMVNQINGQTTTYISGNKVNISGTNTVQTIAGAMEVNSSGQLVIKDGAGLRLRKVVSGSVAEFGVWDENNLTGGVMVTKINGQSAVKISGSSISMSSLETAINSSSITLNAERINLNGYVTTSMLESAFTDADQIACNQLTVSDYFQVGTYVATWKSATYTTYTLSQTHSFMWSDGTSSTNGRLVTATDDHTIYYLGR